MDRGLNIRPLEASLRHAFLNPAILALTLPIGAGSMADDPAGPDAPSPAATPAATTTTGSGSGREAASTGRLHFSRLALADAPPRDGEDPRRARAWAVGRPATLGTPGQGPGGRPVHPRAIPVLDLRLFRWRLHPAHGLPAVSGAAGIEGSARSRPVGCVLEPHGPHRT